LVALGGIVVRVVKSSLFVGLALCWVALTFVVAIGFLPKRPDSCAYFIAQGFMIPGLVLQTKYPIDLFAKANKYREKYGQIGALLMGAAAGGLAICVVLFFFGGFRTAAMN
jgi:hypothetical protein